MAFGLVDVCARANGRGETSGDVAARRRRGNVPPAARSLPPSLVGRWWRTTKHTEGGGGGMGRGTGWMTGWRGVSMLLVNGPGSSRRLQEK